MTSTHNIAYFITPHGFGHASRAAAVMAALSETAVGVHFELFTTCPLWFFENSIGNEFGYHAVETDIGLVQASPLLEDAGLMPFRNCWNWIEARRLPKTAPTRWPIISLKRF